MLANISNLPAERIQHAEVLRVNHLSELSGESVREMFRFQL